MSTTAKISALIITHRSDDRFTRCLESVKWADQILVYDFNSGADWPELRKKFSLTVVTQKGSITDFAATRNAQISEAAHDWVLIIDSDEELEPTAEDVVREFIQKNTYDAGIVTRQDYFLDKALQYGEAGQQSLMRVGRKESLRFLNPVHEVATCSGRIYHLPVRLKHHAHFGIADFFNDVTTYAAIQAQHAHQTGERASLLKMIVWPNGKLIWNLFFKGGIWDGWRGVVYAYIMSLHSFFVRVFLFEMER